MALDDSTLGRRDRRGDWRPNAPIEYPPVFVWPPRPAGFIKWLLGVPGFFFPAGILYMAAAVLVHLYLSPSADTARTFAPDWIAYIWARNFTLVVLLFGGLHLAMYMRRVQGNAFKFNGRLPAPGNDAFLWKDQVRDNIFWTLAGGVSFWTAYEVFMLWMAANGHGPWISWAEHPVWCVAMFLVLPIFRELHFYLVHRFLHIPALYHRFHKLHHNNVNVISWSGLAMHPVEHLLYFSGVLVHLILPSHPLHATFHLLHAGLTPALGHVGFLKVGAMDTNGYPHYLHHKYFECNYADGALPLDKWFGTFHDGTPESLERMNAWFLKQSGQVGASSNI